MQMGEAKEEEEEEEGEEGFSERERGREGGRPLSPPHENRPRGTRNKLDEGGSGGGMDGAAVAAGCKHEAGGSQGSWLGNIFRCGQKQDHQLST